MNKIKLLIVLLAFISFSVAAQQQNYAFKVLVSKGQNEIKSGENWSSIRVGESLKLSDEIKVSANAYLGLMHVNGKPLEIKQPGSYKITELANRIGKGASVINKYTDFILSKEEEKKNKLAATGAVHRGEKDAIQLLLPGPERAFVYGDQATVAWDTETAGPYIVILRNLFEEELSRVEVADKSFTIELKEEKFAAETQIMITVISKTDPAASSAKFTIKRMKQKDRELINKPYQEITSTLEENNALSYYVMAGFYEENLLLIDAITAYQQAIKAAPQVEYYKQEFDAFLKRLELRK